MTSASAPGKIILFGEHAVVYGQPAIAVPVRQVKATAEVIDIADGSPGKIYIQAPDIRFQEWLHACSTDNPLAHAIRLTLQEIDDHDFPALTVHLHSTIPVAAGLGSGAAISVAIIRALSSHLGSALPLNRQSSLAYQVETIHHGKPSGIDNAVITYDKPVFFISGRGAKDFSIGAPLTLIIGVSSVVSSTHKAVGQVYQAWKEQRSHYEAIFDNIGGITELARQATERGDEQELGKLMNENQLLLKQLGVSHPELERLIDAAREAGAIGAKLSGAGLGGNVIALVSAQFGDKVESALVDAGAVWTLKTEVGV
jgi:mevalonate kinase